MKAARLQQGHLEWTGEHWVAMLRVPGAEHESAIVSHYSLRVSPAGEGNVAIVRINDGAGITFDGICTDNEALLPFAIPRFFQQRVAYWDASLKSVLCDFHRTGDATREAGWSIETRDGRRVIETRWRLDGREPEVINTPWRDNKEIFSILCFTDEASVLLDGQSVPGSAFLRDIWRDTLGGDRSSCVVALAESFFNVEARP